MSKITRKLIQFSNYSLCLTLPKVLIRELGLKKGDLLTLETSKDNHVVKIILPEKRSRVAEKSAKASSRW